MEEEAVMLRGRLIIAALVMVICAATTSYALTLSDGFESGNLDDRWYVAGERPFESDVSVRSLLDGAIVHSGTYSMCMYTYGPHAYLTAWWPNLVHPNSLPHSGSFHAWVYVDTSQGAPQLWLEGTYAIAGINDVNGFIVTVPKDSQWHNLSIAYEPQYDDLNGRLFATVDGNPAGEVISSDLEGGQFTGGGFSIVTPTGYEYLKIWVDDCVTNIVPEPGSLMVLGGGLFAAAGLILRKRR